MPREIEKQRRALLKGLAFATGVAIAGVARAQNDGHAANQEAKYAARYRDRPYRDQACAGCYYFIAGTGRQGKCQQVEGNISPAGWCNLYAPRDIS